MKNTITKRIFLLSIFLLGLLWVTACSSSADGRDRRGSSEGEPTPVPTAAVPSKPVYTVERGEVIYKIAFPGRIAPVIEEVLDFDVDGTISEVHVKRGDWVQAGDLIAELDTLSMEEELLRAQSILEIAESRLSSVETELTNEKRRTEINLAMTQLDLNFAQAQADDPPTPEQQHQIDRLTLQVELAQLDLDEITITSDPALQADVAQAQLQVAELEEAIANSNVYAPFDGQITSLTMSRGRAVVMGLPLGTIAQMTELDVSAGLRDSQMQEMAQDMVAIIAPASRPGDALIGSIRYLPYPYGSGGEGEAVEGGDAVRISFDDPDAALELYEAGDRVDVSVIVTERDDVLWLPPAAIRDFNGRKFVVIQEGDFQQRNDVDLGISGEDRTEILDGVNEGQIIVGQ